MKYYVNMGPWQYSTTVAGGRVFIDASDLGGMLRQMADSIRPLEDAEDSNPIEVEIFKGHVKDFVDTFNKSVIQKILIKYAPNVSVEDG
jgi:hypothetical protein